MMAWIEVLLKGLITGLIVLVMGVGLAFLSVLLRRWLAVRADKEHTLRVINRGNCRSRYFLTAASPEPGLSFTFLFNQVPLAGGPVEARESGQKSMQSAEAQKKDPARTSAQTGTTSAPLKSAGSKAGSMASMLGSLAALLPGKLGDRFRDQSAQMRSVQVQSARASQVPAKYNRQLGALQKTSGLQGQASPGTTLAQAQQGSPETDQAAGSFAGDQAGSRTGELLPGESVSLTLRIGTYSKRYPVGSFNYTVSSRQEALDFPESMIEPLSKNGTVYFAPIEWWRYWLLPVMNTLLFLLALIATLKLILLLWQ